MIITTNILIQKHRFVKIFERMKYLSMNGKEAIERLRDHMRVHKLNEPQAHFINIAHEMGISALEKQISKLVRWTPSHQSYFSAGDEAESYCPICDEYVIEDEDIYCKKCGQLLAYREEEMQY